MRAVGYVRVSTDEQADSGAGLAAQREAIRHAAESRGWELLDVVADEGISGKNLDRPGVRKVLDAMAEGWADVLVISTVDRLSRSLVDFAGIMQTAQSEGWACIALDLPIDTTTPVGEAMASIVATFAQLERRMIGQRTQKAMAAKAAQGFHMGRRSTLEAETENRIIELRQAGESYGRIASILEAEGRATGQGGTRWYKSSVRAVYNRLAEGQADD